MYLLFAYLLTGLIAVSLSCFREILMNGFREMFLDLKQQRRFKGELISLLGLMALVLICIILIFIYPILFLIRFLNRKKIQAQDRPLKTQIKIVPKRYNICYN